VFSLVLSPSLATLSPALPATLVTSGAAIAVCFSPEEDCAAFAVRAIDNAEREILVGAYGLTKGSGIVEALVRAKGRGVDVRLIATRPRLPGYEWYRTPWPRQALSAVSEGERAGFVVSRPHR
jgi:phosphatidylserine/phosphatidylglycerophosphate/cardiolipin synthase-like enzyme